MGHRNPDRIVSPPSPVLAMTLAEMHLAKWELRARCNRCSTELRADLRSMIRVYGPDAIWWGRKPACPGWGCNGGELTYSARALPSGSWVAMTTVPSQATIDMWKGKRGVTDRGPRNT
ncbi:MAG: hypothetical protein ACREE0_22930 [Phenylobacterium sp.]